MTRPVSAPGPVARDGSGERTWRQRVNDPDEPLFTLAVVTELLGTDPQTLRRLERAMNYASSRPSGNQRRYSRRDLESLSVACELNGEGFSPSTVAKILSRDASTRHA